MGHERRDERPRAANGDMNGGPQPIPAFLGLVTPRLPLTPQRHPMGESAPDERHRPTDQRLK
jgi:hypothetical protein